MYERVALSVATRVCRRSGAPRASLSPKRPRCCRASYRGDRSSWTVISNRRTWCGLYLLRHDLCVRTRVSRRLARCDTWTGRVTRCRMRGTPRVSLAYERVALSGSIWVSGSSGAPRVSLSLKLPTCRTKHLFCPSWGHPLGLNRNVSLDVQMGWCGLLDRVRERRVLAFLTVRSNTNGQSKSITWTINLPAPRMKLTDDVKLWSLREWKWTDATEENKEKKSSSHS